MPPFPTGFNQVLEIKTSWRIMGANDDATRYYVVSANIEGIGTKTLGLVGMHNIVNTQGTSRVRLGHIRTPRQCTQLCCGQRNTKHDGIHAPATCKWMVLCELKLQRLHCRNYTDGTSLKTTCQASCTFNQNASKPVLDAQGNVMINGPKGTTPSDICLDPHYDTSGPLPSGDDVNIPNIQYLNTLLVGPSGIITSLESTSPMSILKYYYLDGAVWTNVDKITSNSQLFSSALTGSIKLANSTMESFTQLSNGFKDGCFSCHSGASNNNTALASHLFEQRARSYQSLQREGRPDLQPITC